MHYRSVVLIGREGETTNLLFNAVARSYRTHVILERPPRRADLVRSRIRRLGVSRVVGQLLFHLVIAGPLHRLSARRRHEIMLQYGMQATPPPTDKTGFTSSVNSADCINQVHEVQPQVVLVNGTRILSATTLAGLGVPVINVHAGITPKYRGVHGGYWALANKDPENCGVTVHLVDPGIDTGGILHQALIHPTSKDNFTTYPTLQTAVGCDLLVRAIDEVMEGKQQVLSATTVDRRWYHPTLVQYLVNRLRSGIR